MPRYTAIAAAVLAMSVTAVAQTPPAESAESRLDRVEKRLAEMDQRYQQDLKSRDEEIARLKQQLQSSTQAAGATSATAPADDIEQSKAAVMKDIEAHQSPLTLRTPASFNPDIAVITDFVGNASTNSDNPARNRFDLDSVELDLRAAVDPRADAVVVLPISRSVDDPLFFDPDNPGDGEITTSIEIEEAYLYLHDFGADNLTAKLGRFHLQFGHWNQMHSHNWQTVDNAFAVQSFLGDEALGGSGLSLSYLVPPKVTGNEYIELVAEVVNGEEDGPVVNNTAVVNSPALNTHVKWNHDLSSTWNMELGGSFLVAKHDSHDSQNALLSGLDLTFVHTDPSGRFNNQLITMELIHGDVDVAPDDTQHSWGAFLLAQQQLDRDWYAGVRLDWTEDALDSSKEVWAVSPYVSWYWSEFLRLRMEYQHKAGDAPTEDTLYFQANWVFGAHPPHPYWAMR